MGSMLHSRLLATTKAGQTLKITGSVLRISHLRLAVAATSSMRASTSRICRLSGEGILHRGGDAVDVAHGHGDLDIAARVEVLDGHGERLEGLAPEFVDALVTAAVTDHLAEFQRLDQAMTAFAHQRVVGGDLDPGRLQVHQAVEDIGRAIEERTREHGSIDALAFGIGLGLVGGAGLFQPPAGDVDAMLDMIEQASRQGLNQLPSRLETIPGWIVILDPVPIIVDMGDTIDLAHGAVARGLIHASHQCPWLGMGLV